MKVEENIKKPISGESGFGLMEMVFAMVVFVVGTLGVLGLITEALKVQKASRESTEALAVARATMERVSSRLRTQRVVGGSLDNNSTGYHDMIGTNGQTTASNAKYVTRWQIEERDAAVPATADIPAGVQRITVRVSALDPGVLRAPVEIRTLLK